jgi:hypothetical protein
LQVKYDKNIRRYMTEYVSRLSNTCQRRIEEIKADTHSSGYLSSRAGREDKATKSIARAAESLFSNFPHNESLNRREFIDLVRQYAPDTEYEGGKAILIK